ncbi:MAG: hypothetical protein A3J24_11505 [Deltaproteobacteria bacterium RIFCSPLOWO2_02_FULL_53_8]|nr:MAG: hypothetical protein A3J24_11505 [Deltaproteobacteria bacterium RIFCSPLOWO2_02_FULL_53_8]
MNKGADKPHVIVSACLLGIKTRYDGTDARSEDTIARLTDRIIIPVCPEQLGGLPTPRPRASIQDSDGSKVLSGKSRVINANGSDVTNQFISGAEAALHIARLTGATQAFLKEKSPSCGVKHIKQNDSIIDGSGVTAALLKEAGIKVEGF